MKNLASGGFDCHYQSLLVAQGLYVCYPIVAKLERQFLLLKSQSCKCTIRTTVVALRCRLFRKAKADNGIYSEQKSNFPYRQQILTTKSKWPIITLYAISRLGCSYICTQQPKVFGIPTCKKIQLGLKLYSVVGSNKILTLAPKLTSQLKPNSERPNHSKLRSAEPRSFGQIHRSFGRSFGRISGHKMRKKTVNFCQKIGI